MILNSPNHIIYFDLIYKLCQNQFELNKFVFGNCTNDSVKAKKE